VLLEHYLVRRSRDKCQNNCHKSETRLVSSTGIFADSRQVLTALILVTDITWFLDVNLARQSRDNCHETHKRL